LLANFIPLYLEKNDIPIFFIIKSVFSPGYLILMDVARSRQI